MSKHVPKLSFAIVQSDEAALHPYPYIHVETDGSARELHLNERKYLETPFDPFDGARPYVKQSYSQKDGWGEIKGFLKRSALPQDVQIHPAPLEDPCKPLSKEELIRRVREKGFAVVEGDDRTVITKKLVSSDRKLES